MASNTFVATNRMLRGAMVVTKLRLKDRQHLNPHLTGITAKVSNI
jgi:hypothetical protein